MSAFDRSLPAATRASKSAGIGFACCVCLLCAPIASLAAEPLAVSPPSQPLRDPYVPPASRKTPASGPTEGAALRQQVERKLRQAFDDADSRHTGTLTRQQANAGGLGFVARHFDAIDRSKAGAVTFDDVKRYLIERGAQLE